MVKGTGFLSLLTYSGYRKDVLFLLLERQRTLTEIKDYFNVKSPEICPRLSELEDSGLIIKTDGAYELTPFGEVLTKQLKPLLDSIQAMESNKDFWDRHDVSTIPDSLLDKIGQLKDCNVSKLESYKIGGSHIGFLKNVGNSESFRGVTSVLNPQWVDLFSELSGLNVSIEIIITAEIFEAIKLNYPEQLKEYLKNPNAHIYVSDDDLRIGISTISGRGWTFFSMALNNKFTGDYDTQTDLQGYRQEAFKWGEELFKHYKENAVEVPRIQEVNKFVFSDEINEELGLDYL